MTEKYLFESYGEQNLECSDSSQEFGFDLWVTEPYAPKLEVHLEKENFDSQ